MPWFSHPIKRDYGMVVAEALSVGTPVFLTDKVNLWREVTQAGAGLVYGDDRSGIDRLLSDWRNNRHAGMSEASLRCFEEKLHIRNCAKKTDRTIGWFGESGSCEEHMKITILQRSLFAGAGIARRRDRESRKPSVRLLPKRATKSPMFQGFATACLHGKRSERCDIFASGVRMRFQVRGCSNYWRCLICFGPGGFFPRRTYWLPMLSGRRFFFPGIVSANFICTSDAFPRDK